VPADSLKLFSPLIYQLLHITPFHLTRSWYNMASLFKSTTTYDPIFALLNEDSEEERDRLTKRWVDHKLEELNFVGIVVSSYSLTCTPQTEGVHTVLPFPVFLLPITATPTYISCLTTFPGRASRRCSYIDWFMADSFT